MKPPLVFIHGMFLTGKCWEDWVRHFEARGHACLAPSWPLHDGEPSELRARVPEGAGALALETVIESYARLVPGEGEPPVLIGHSVGGLIVQRLVSAGLGRAGICISSVAPNSMLALDQEFLRASTAITDPSQGDKPYEMTPEGFHQNFANTMSREESDRAYARYAVHESRNVLRDCLGAAGRVDLERPHAPLLFVAGDQDRIIPGKLNEKNARAYTDPDSTSDFVEFPGRGHFLCGQPGWEDIADYIEGWLETHLHTAGSIFASNGSDVLTPARR